MACDGDRIEASEGIQRAESLSWCLGWSSHVGKVSHVCNFWVFEPKPLFAWPRGQGLGPGSLCHQAGRVWKGRDNRCNWEHSSWGPGFLSNFQPPSWGLLIVDGLGVSQLTTFVSFPLVSQPPCGYRASEQNACPPGSLPPSTPRHPPANSYSSVKSQLKRHFLTKFF